MLLGAIGYGQREIQISSTVLGNHFVKAHLLTHNAANEVVDIVSLNPPLELPKYLSLKAPADNAFHTVTLVLVRDPQTGGIPYYNIQIATLWDNQQDTISKLDNFNVQQPAGKVPKNKKVTLNITNVGKLDDLYSPSINEDLFGKARKVGSSYELDLPLLSPIGRTIFLVNKKDKRYRQILLPPLGAGEAQNDFSFDYRELPVHDGRVTINPMSADPYRFYLTAADMSDNQYALYNSPGTTFESEETLTIDVPVEFPVKTYYATTQVSNAPTTRGQYCIVVAREAVASVESINFPELESKQNFVTAAAGEGYNVDISGKPYDVWSLFHPIRGYVNPGTGQADILLQSSYWSVRGKGKPTVEKVQLPKLPTAIINDLLGSDCRVITEQDNWVFATQQAAATAYKKIEFRWHISQ